MGILYYGISIYCIDSEQWLKCVLINKFTLSFRSYVVEEAIFKDMLLGIVYEDHIECRVQILTL